MNIVLHTVLVVVVVVLSADVDRVARFSRRSIPESANDSHRPNVDVQLKYSTVSKATSLGSALVYFVSQFPFSSGGSSSSSTWTPFSAKASSAGYIAPSAHAFAGGDPPPATEVVLMVNTHTAHAIVFTLAEHHNNNDNVKKPKNHAEKPVHPHRTQSTEAALTA